MGGSENNQHQNSNKRRGVTDLILDDNKSDEVSKTESIESGEGGDMIDIMRVVSGNNNNNNMMIMDEEQKSLTSNMEMLEKSIRKASLRSSIDYEEAKKKKYERQRS